LYNHNTYTASISQLVGAILPLTALEAEVLWQPTAELCNKIHSQEADLEEALFVKEPANVRDDACPCDEVTANTVVHYQVQIPLPKPRLLTSATI